VTLTELTERLCTTLESGPRLRLAVLFGSRAMERARPGSDVDLAIVPWDPHLSLWDEGALASRVEEAIGCDVDLVRLDLAPTLLRWEIIKHGIPIVAASPDEWTKLLVRVLSEHADYAPSADRAARALVRHVASAGAS
jgi:uncharacterized protein